MRPEQVRALLRERHAFLFDLDGTLVDSAACHERAFVEVLRAYRPSLLNRFQYERYKGRNTASVFADLGAGSESDCVVLTAAKQELYQREIRSGRVEVITGAHELLTGLLAAGKKLFLVSGGGARSIAAVLEATGLARYFSGVITGESGIRSKPAPDPFLECLARFGLARGHSVVVEDAAAGVEAARAARLACIAVNNRSLSDYPEFAGTLADVADALVPLEATRG